MPVSGADKADGMCGDDDTVAFELFLVKKAIRPKSDAAGV